MISAMINICKENISFIKTALRGLLYIQFMPQAYRASEIRFINLFIEFESFGDDLIMNSNLNIKNRIPQRFSLHLQGQKFSYMNIFMQRHHGVLIYRSVLWKHRVFIWVASGKRRWIHTLVNTRPWWEPIILYCKSRL